VFCQAQSHREKPNKIAHNTFSRPASQLDSALPWIHTWSELRLKFHHCCWPCTNCVLSFDNLVWFSSTHPLFFTYSILILQYVSVPKELHTSFSAFFGLHELVQVLGRFPDVAPDQGVLVFSSLFPDNLSQPFTRLQVWCPILAMRLLSIEGHSVTFFLVSLM
jgi:hypothetical protein